MRERDREGVGQRDGEIEEGRRETYKERETDREEEGEERDQREGESREGESGTYWRERGEIRGREGERPGGAWRRWITTKAKAAHGEGDARKRRGRCHDHFVFSPLTESITSEQALPDSWLNRRRLGGLGRVTPSRIVTRRIRPS